MSVTGTCGHELDTHWFMMGYCDVRVACTGIGGYERVVVPMELCPACKDEFRERGILLETPEDEERWLKGE